MERQRLEVANWRGDQPRQLFNKIAIAYFE